MPIVRTLSYSWGSNKRQSNFTRQMKAIHANVNSLLVCYYVFRSKVMLLKGKYSIVEMINDSTIRCPDVQSEVAQQLFPLGIYSYASKFCDHMTICVCWKPLSIFPFGSTISAYHEIDLIFSFAQSVKYCSTNCRCPFWNSKCSCAIWGYWVHNICTHSLFQSLSSILSALH